MNRLEMMDLHDSFDSEESVTIECQDIITEEVSLERLNNVRAYQKTRRTTNDLERIKHHPCHHRYGRIVRLLSPGSVLTESPLNTMANVTPPKNDDWFIRNAIYCWQLLWRGTSVAR